MTTLSDTVLDLAPAAKVICDSVYDGGTRVTTLEAIIHRFVLAELNTHRLISRDEADAPLTLEEFSRNSASSRAIPVKKQLERVATSPAIPVTWPAEQKGMQGGDALQGDAALAVSNVWSRNRTAALVDAQALTRLGLHKSVTNRLLEPHMWHTVVITATNWDGFWSQRLDENAQPEIRAAAQMMKFVYDLSQPAELPRGHWHLPYIEREDITAVEEYLYHSRDLPGPSTRTVTKALVMVSTARCARTSYLTHDGKREVGEDLRLYNRLVEASPVHYSPAEHPCRPEPTNERTTVIYPSFGGEAYDYTGPVYGNLTGWHQHRFDLMGC